jgi:tRNA threonylcarbamoyladenosine biosynthesis protein TsaE
VDCYRLRGPEDAESIGLDEMLNGDHIVVIEWPERVAALLPSEALHVQIEIGEMQDGRETRLLTLRAVGERAAALLSDVKGEAD